MGGKEKATQPPFKLACPEGLEDKSLLIWGSGGQLPRLKVIKIGHASSD